MLKYLILLTAIILIGLTIKEENNKAMESCMKTHSFETCFYTLNH